MSQSSSLLSTTCKVYDITIVFLLLLVLSNRPVCAAGGGFRSRFGCSGPVVTITVKDPLQLVDNNYNQPIINVNYSDNDNSNNDDGIHFTTTNDSSNNNNNNNNNRNSKDTLPTRYQQHQQHHQLPPQQQQQQPKIPIIDLSSIRPNIQWNIFSKGGPPLPLLVPILQSLSCTIGYQYNDIKYLPAWIESTIKCSLPGYNTYGNELQIQPSYVTKTKQTNVCIQMNHQQQSYIFIQLKNQVKRTLQNIYRNKDNPKNNNSNSGWMIDIIRGSWYWPVPSASISSIRITPTIDFTKDVNRQYVDYSCIFEAVTGGIGRTRAILDLQYNNPTLSFLYQPNERNLLSPEISLYTGNIIYQWQTLLGGGSTSIGRNTFRRTKSRNISSNSNKSADSNDVTPTTTTGTTSTNGIDFDVDDTVNNNKYTGSVIMKINPSSAIDITWIDETKSGGSWVTDVRIPLDISYSRQRSKDSTTTSSSSTGTTTTNSGTIGSTTAASSIFRSLVADVRVRRQFKF